MSADNWAKCPRCAKEEITRSEEKHQAIKDSYGKISPEEYLELIQEDNKLLHHLLENDLREDYEIYVDEDGLFKIYYGCQCSKCGFSHSFNHKEQLEINKETE